jgi:steroid delta-isomerase-like uncharacterized protein
MSTEDNKALARRGFEETLNQRNLTVLDELHVHDFMYHSPSRTIQGREPFKQFMSMLLTTFPDLHVSIEDVIGEGDRVVVRFTLRGTHQGELMGIAPTGKQVAMTGISIIRVANGKFLEEWANTDWLGLLQQLGVISAPGQAS